MAESFISAVAEQLQNNLGDTVQALAGEDMGWGEFMAQVLSQVLISAVYLALFIGPDSGRCDTVADRQATCPESMVLSSAQRGPLPRGIGCSAGDPCPVRG